MSLHLLRADMTAIPCDAMVVPANSTLLSGGSVFGAVSSAAGQEFFEKCRILGGCAAGEAKYVSVHYLPCRYVILTAGPVWEGGNTGETKLLADCYRNSLQLARKLGAKKIAFGLIDSGIYGYPPEIALQTAVDAITDYLAKHTMQVYLVMFDWVAYHGRSGGSHALQAYIDKHFTGNRAVPAAPVLFAANAEEVSPIAAKPKRSVFKRREQKPVTFGLIPDSLSKAVAQVDESFSQMLLRKIDESGMTDAECYKKANIDRRLFSKIRSDIHYKPKKTTAIAFALALELDLEETKELLMKAGFALTHSSKFDIIVEYFIEREEYDLFAINEALFRFDQVLIGSSE